MNISTECIIVHTCVKLQKWGEEWLPVKVHLLSNGVPIRESSEGTLSILSEEEFDDLEDIT